MDVDTEKSEMNALERFLIWFLVPVVFGVVLVMVLLTLFGYDTKNGLLTAANKIPVVSKWVPDTKPAAQGGAGAASEDKLAAKEKEIAELQAKLQEQTKAAKEFQSAFLRKDQELKDLQAKQEKVDGDTGQQGNAKDAAYDEQVKQTSEIYAQMTPSKAAPILQNMTVNEQVLILGGMKPDEQMSILERMDPLKAAEVTALLKEQIPSKDIQIAALQERVKLLETAKSAGNTTVDLGKTFSGMDPKKAAEVLLEMNKTNPGKVIDILKAADSQGRSAILSAMTGLDKQKTAVISGKL